MSEIRNDTAAARFQEGDYQGAMALASDAVRSRPTDHAARIRLAQFLCFQGAWDKVDRHLEAVMTQAGEMTVTISLWRQLVRAAVARDEFHTQGRVPEFVADPSPHVKLRLQAAVALREDDEAGAATALNEADQSMPPLRFTINQTPVDPFRDLDDLQAGRLECLASNGKYYWIDFADIESIKLEPPENPLDLLWRPADVTMVNGVQGRLYVPAMYPGSDRDESPEVILGRRTEWEERNGLVIGRGCRMYLAGDEALSVFELQQLAIDHSGEGSG